MELIFSVPAVLICLSAVSPFFLIAITVALAGNSSALHLRLWALTFWAPAIGGILIACRAFAPLWLSDYVGCMLFLTGLGCVWLGMRAFFHLRPSFLLLNLVVLGLVPVGLTFDGTLEDLSLSREIYIFASAALFYFLTAEEVLRGTAEEPLPSARYAVLAYRNFGFIHAAAIPFAVFDPIVFVDGMPVSVWLYCLIILSLLQTVAVGYLGVILGKERVELAVRRLANTDELTGLNNRRAFINLVRTSLESESARGGALLILDLDHFKRINDTYGHQTGDKALKCFAGFLMSVSQRNAISGRVGGEEFALFVGGLRGPAVKRLAGEICRAASLLKIQHDGERIDLTVSIGLTDTGSGPTEFDQLYAEADLALYRAKKAGRNRACRFVPELKTVDQPASSDSKMRLTA